MTVEVHVTEDGLVVSGELDMAAADEFWKSAALAVNPAREVVVDIAELTFIDAAGLTALIRFVEEICPHGVVLRSPRDIVLRIIELLQIETLAAIRIERPDA
jgi:anti-anti-sigma factor